MGTLPHVETLRASYDRMRSKNSGFSMNAFARYIGMPASHLNEVINLKCGLSEAKAKKILKKLEVSDLEKQLFLLSVRAHHSRSSAERDQAQQELSRLEKDSATQLKLETFSMISSWYHFAILELMNLDDFQADPLWISKRINVELSVVKNAIARLQTLGLIKVTDRGWERHEGLVETTTDIPSLAVKKYHSQVLHLADQALFRVPVEKREYNSVMIAIDKDRMDEAKKKVREFQKKMVRDFSNKSPKKNTLACVSIQLFPLSQ